jgi:hypothetical protein
VGEDLYSFQSLLIVVCGTRAWRSRDRAGAHVRDVGRAFPIEVGRDGGRLLVYASRPPTEPQANNLQGPSFMRGTTVWMSRSISKIILRKIITLGSIEIFGYISMIGEVPGNFLISTPCLDDVLF